MAKPIKMRYLKLKEIIDTEINYVKSLKQLVNIFYLPLEKISKRATGLFSSPLITNEEHKKIFLNISPILQFHINFLTVLSAEFDKWPSSVRIGKIFVQYSPFLKLYTDFTNSFQSSSDTIQILMRRPAFEAWIEDTQRKNPTVQPLNALMIMPIQRVPRYRLLLDELIKFTPEEHVDLADLRKAIELIKNIASFINEKKRESENISEIASIQPRLKGVPFNLAHPLRKLHMKGELTRIAPSNALEKRFFFLFTDMLLSTTGDFNASSKLTYDGYILLRDACVSSFVKNSFSITFKHNKLVKYVAESEESRDKWIEATKAAIKELSTFPEVFLLFFSFLNFSYVVFCLLLSFYLFASRRNQPRTISLMMNILVLVLPLKLAILITSVLF